MKNAGVVGATVASSGGVDGFDCVDGGFDGFDGVEWWFGGLVASMASMVGVDGGLGLRHRGHRRGSPSVSPVVRTARTAVACSLFEQNAGCQWRLSIAL